MSIGGVSRESVEEKAAVPSKEGVIEGDARAEGNREAQESAARNEAAQENREAEIEKDRESKNEIIDPQAELKRLGEALKQNEEEITRIRQLVEGDQGRLMKIREELGLPAGEGIKSWTRERLEELLGEKKELEQEQEEAEAVDDLDKVLEMMSKLPKIELTIIVQTGKGKDGKPIEGEHGALNPDVAKKLAKLAEEGVTKITKAVFETILGIAKGLAKGIFEAVKAAAGKQG